jgi:hypothetical protein
MVWKDVNNTPVNTATLTPYTKVLLEKQAVHSAIQQIPSHLWNLKDHIFT